MTTPADITIDEVRAILSTVMDPEIPVLSVMDLGIVRSISIQDGRIAVSITPTYSGCPAMDMIAASIRMELMSHGFFDPVVTLQLDPAWTTDWMTEAGKSQLKTYGIAPPMARQHASCNDLFREESVQCPHCESWHTHLLSEFGSTACKSLYKCDDCLEPFDYFKCH
ncbi:MAG: 1,2-phenylacetyl-CoA epoxidase subunit PaaD [Chitinophagaceae bacterium]